MQQFCKQDQRKFFENYLTFLDNFSVEKKILKNEPKEEKEFIKECIHLLQSTKNKDISTEETSIPLNFYITLLLLERRVLLMKVFDKFKEKEILDEQYLEDTARESYGIVNDSKNEEWMIENLFGVHFELYESYIHYLIQRLLKKETSFNYDKKIRKNLIKDFREKWSKSELISLARKKEEKIQNFMNIISTHYEKAHPKKKNEPNVQKSEPVKTEDFEENLFEDSGLENQRSNVSQREMEEYYY